ncbi:LysM peptidoglycan-binding domain-containing protein [Phaeobacter porticola]|uniref:LysM domain protein n=1 Tax=Phaeobacter porticola TaxID=1844006 RepID=A0A1L3I5C4_9RHOB|nr:LysM peptidoglycan-binding domain-containing protein [Phaeobacter porticola]APG47350.1 LysM domain protein [Phaeobacter porticola]
MTIVTGKSGLSTTTIGGVAAVVAVLGGVVFLQWGGSEKEDPQGSRSAEGEQVVISPSSSSDRKLVSPVVANDAADTGNEKDSLAEADQVDTPVAEPAAEATPTETAAGDAVADTNDVAAAETAEEATDVAGFSAPQMDLARFEMDGSGMVAGRAAPGSVLSLMLDGTVIETLTVPPDGAFVLFTSVAPSDQPQVISLEAALDGAVLASDAQFILAPVSPVEVAVAEEPTASQVALADTPDAEPKVTGTRAAEAEVADVNADPTPEIRSDEVAPTAEVTTPEQPEGATAEVIARVDTSDETEAVQSTGDVAEGVAQVTADEDVAQLSEPATTAQPETAVTADAEAASVPDDAQAAPNRVAVLRADASGVQLVQPTTPTLAEAPDTVALDTISYDAEGAVVLSGRVRSDAVVRAYLDNSAIADLPVDDDGRWSGILPDVAPGIYALRLDALDTEGKVLSRLETPFKREAPEVLQPAVDIAAASPDVSPTGATPLVRVVTVQKGDTLWAISRERYGDGLLYVRVFDANREAIRNPDLIYPGQVFAVPVQ